MTICLARVSAGPARDNSVAPGAVAPRVLGAWGYAQNALRGTSFAAIGEVPNSAVQKEKPLPLVCRSPGIRPADRDVRGGVTRVGQYRDSPGLPRHFLQPR